MEVERENADDQKETAKNDVMCPYVYRFIDPQERNSAGTIQHSSVGYFELLRGVAVAPLFGWTFPFA